MEPHSWNKIIKYFNDSSDFEINLWRYVTALRGPDDDSIVWKKILTCLLRGQCSNALNITDTFAYFKGENFEKIHTELNNTFEKIPLHYLYHTADGFEALSDYYYVEMKNKQLGRLFSRLSQQIRHYDTLQIARIVKTIVGIMHDGKE